MHGSWSWRLPYALQWMWPLPLAALIVFAPESPWWLVRKGRFEEAKQSVRRCTRPGLYTEGEIAGYIEYMAHTDALDRAEQAKGSFTDMFKGTNLRRTEIQIGTWMAQIWKCGFLDLITLTVANSASAEMRSRTCPSSCSRKLGSVPPSPSTSP